MHRWKELIIANNSFSDVIVQGQDLSLYSIHPDLRLRAVFVGSSNTSCSAYANNIVVGATGTSINFWELTDPVLIDLV
jgi:hypothetical protein